MNAEPFAQLRANVSRALEHDGRARTRALEDAVDDFVSGGWKHASGTVEQEIVRRPREEAEVIEGGRDRLLTHAERIWPAPDGDQRTQALFGARMQQVTSLAGEYLLAMEIAGEEPERATTAAALLQELLENVHLAGRLQQMATAERVRPGTFAPAVVASIMATDAGEDGVGEEDPEAVLKRTGLDKRHLLSGHAAGQASRNLCEMIRQGRERFSTTLDTYHRLGKRHFRESPPDFIEETPKAYRSIVAQMTHNQPPDTDIRTLVAFAASAKGGSLRARVEGAAELVQTLIVGHRVREGRHGVDYNRTEDVFEAVAGLRRLSSIVDQEKAVHKEVSGKWADFERETEFERRRDPSKVTFELPEDMASLDARALYIHEAIAKGVPLGVVLSDIYDSPHLSFGPTENAYVTRLAFYGARKYAANFAIHEEGALERLAEERNPMRAEEVRQLLRGVEIDLRAHEHEDDDELRQRGHDQIRQLVNEGLLRGDEEKMVKGLVSKMIQRVRANQEVRYLSAMMGLKGEVTEDMVRDYANLPHTRHFAESRDPQTQHFNITARNGQKLNQLELDTRVRWMRYRQRAVPGQDVRNIDLPGPKFDPITIDEEDRQPIRSFDVGGQEIKTRRTSKSQGSRQRSQRQR